MKSYELIIIVAIFICIIIKLHNYFSKDNVSITNQILTEQFVGNQKQADAQAAQDQAQAQAKAQAKEKIEAKVKAKAQAQAQELHKQIKSISNYNINLRPKKIN